MDKQLKKKRKNAEREEAADKRKKMQNQRAAHRLNLVEGTATEKAGIGEDREAVDGDRPADDTTNRILFNNDDDDDAAVGSGGSEKEGDDYADDDVDDDEMPSERFRRGGDLPSDLDMGSECGSAGSEDPIDEEDDGDWNMMGAALEREFLGME